MPNARPNRSRAHLVRLVGGVSVVLLGSIRCQVPLDPQPLQRFETCDALQLYLEDQILHPGAEQSFATGGPVVGCYFDAGLSADEAPRAGEGEGEGDGRVFTQTTTQEENVDEPDIVKNNGDYIFVLRRGEMIILSAWPADDVHILSRTQLAGTPTDMLFDDENDRVLVMSSVFAERARVNVKLYDVTDVTEPVLLRDTLIDGTLTDARMVGSEVMLVTQSELAVNFDRNFAPFSDDENREKLRAAGLGRILPKISDFIVGQDTSPRVNDAVACDNTYAPSRSDGRSILLVHALDMADETSDLRSTGVVAGFSHVYASTVSLYLASTETSDGGYFTPHFSTTRIHKLSGFQGTGAAEYQATGVVLGQIKDELSLDEDEATGTLRVVVTDNSGSNDLREQTTSLVVLEQPDAESTDLVEVSRVDDIGRGEGVESVRFIGDKAYVVTYPLDLGFFLNERGLPSIPFTDPLFVIDLAEPKAPRLRGELKVSGYSAYIHPLDDTHLLTVGVNTNEANEFLGLSLIVFDVADPDAPAVLHRHDFGGSNIGSEALVERHAFTYFGAEKALAIPVQRFVQDPFGGFNALSSSALAVFRVDLDGGFTPLGEIEQSNLYPNLTGGPENSLTGEDPFFVGPCASVRRSVMIADTDEGAFVYAISTGGVTAAALTDGLPTVASVRLGSLDDEVCSPIGSVL